MRVVDLRAVGAHLSSVGREISPRCARADLLADALVVGVEQHAERGSKGAKRGSKRSSTKVSKNQVVCARCHLAGLASGMDWTWQSSADSGAASASEAARTCA